MAQPSEQIESGSRSIRVDLSVRSFVLAVCACAAVWMVIRGLPALLVIATALMLVGALNPFVGWLERKRFKRGAAIAVVFGVLILGSVGGLILILPSLGEQVRALVDHAPEFRNHLADMLQRHGATAPLAEQLRSARMDDLVKNSEGALLKLSRSVIELIAASIAVVFLAIYVMIDRDRLLGAVFAVAPKRRHVALSRILLNLETIVGGYIRGQVITCILMATYIFVLLVACHVPNALAIAAFGGVVDLLPYIGIVLTMAPAVAAAFAVGPGVAAIVFVLLLVYEEIEGRILIPIVYGRALRLPSSVVFIALLIGGSVSGVVGALLALPIAAAVLMLIDELRVELPGETEESKERAQDAKDQKAMQEYEARAKDKPVTEAAAVAVEIAAREKGREDVIERAVDNEDENRGKPRAKE